MVVSQGMKDDGRRTMTRTEFWSTSCHAVSFAETHPWDRNANVPGPRTGAAPRGAIGGRVLATAALRCLPRPDPGRRGCWRCPAYRIRGRRWRGFLWERGFARNQAAQPASQRAEGVMAGHDGLDRVDGWLRLGIFSIPEHNDQPRPCPRASRPFPSGRWPQGRSLANRWRGRKSESQRAKEEGPGPRNCGVLAAFGRR